jgi:hypothetical protein
MDHIMMRKTRSVLATVGLTLVTLLAGLLNDGMLNPAVASPQDDFINAAGPAAQRGQVEYGVPASVTVAQAILESGWGTSSLSVQSKNYFGIKCATASSPGPIAVGCKAYQTTECTPDCHTVTAYFRVYATMEDSFRDHGRFLRDNSRYANAFNFTHDADQFVREIWKAGYATDPNYPNKVITLMVNHNLYRFNTVGRPAQVVIVGMDNVVYHEVRQTDGQWTGFQPLDGFDGPARAKRVSIASMPDGSAQVAIIAADDVVYHRVRAANGQWTGFQSLAGAGTTSPAQGKDVAIAGLPDGSAQVVIVGTDNVVYHEARLSDGRWTGFQPLAGFDAPAQAKRVSIAGMGDGSAQVGIIAVDDVVYHQVRYPTGQWTGFQPLAGAGTTSAAQGKDVAIAGLPDGSAQAVIIGTDDVVYHEARLPDGRWTGFQPLSAAGGWARAKQVSIGGVPGGVAHVAIVAADDVVYHQLRQPDGQWTGFQPLAGAGTTTPAQGRDVAIG